MAERRSLVPSESEFPASIQAERGFYNPTKVGRSLVPTMDEFPTSIQSERGVYEPRALVPTLQVERKRKRASMPANIRQ
jgi:hypothetical protein